MGRVRTGPTWRLALRAVSFACVLAMLLTPTAPAFADNGPASLPDFPIPNGHFYTQASGKGSNYGFSITDGSGANFNSEFLRLGGVDQLGYPASDRFVLDGFATQATQKALLQWRPDADHVAFVNVFDLFSERGLDPILARTRLIPPTPDNVADRGLTWPEVVARHLSILDQNPAIKKRYFSSPDPIDDFGLPQSSQDFGGVFVIRCERAAFQQWRIDTSFARAGDVTQVNAGDLAKEFGLIPPDATNPILASRQLISPLGQEFRADPGTAASAVQSASQARPSLVRIDVVLPDSTGIASGIVIDNGGDIMTNAHVVTDAMLIRVTFVNGNQSSAQVLGVDSGDDLALIRVPVSSIGSGIAPASIVGGAGLRPGQYLVAMGFSPYFPSPPSVRIGVFQQTIPTTPVIIQSDMYILPGDSGGMLLNTSGQVVGVNDEIRFTHEARQPLISFSIDALDALHIAQSLEQGR